MNEKPDFEKEKSGFVNEKRRGEDPPDFLTEKLDNNMNRELMQIAVLRELYQGNRPYYSLSQIQGRFGASKKTVGSRLDEMTELGVLRKGVINNGDHWWIDWGISEYPIPPDVEVYEPNDEETVSEFFNKLHIQMGVIALLATVIGGAVVWLGTLQISGAFSLPVPASDILSVGLLTQAVAYMLLLVAIVVWMMQKAISSDEEEIDIYRLLGRE
ncbi:hypothetical protein [Halorarum halobium]|uniref:hypothetical protein n=1 Tax=Halorarum halobium TaxID=3075121 RepID=UPI0028B01C19|nr:hypothetical protein [Halobaculum sp. XH14]